MDDSPYIYRVLGFETVFVMMLIYVLEGGIFAFNMMGYQTIQRGSGRKREGSQVGIEPTTTLKRLQPLYMGKAL